MPSIFLYLFRHHGLDTISSKAANNLQDAGHWMASNQGGLWHHVVNIFIALTIFISGVVLARLASKYIHKLMESHAVDITIADFVSTLSRYLMLAGTVVVVLGRIGIQTTTIIAALSAAGLAIGLALQGSLSHFASGVILVTFRPFRAGEYIEMGSVSGTVDKVHVFSTTLRTSDNKIIVIPNGKALSSNIVNYSREPLRRVDILTCVSCNADIDEVKQAIGECIENDPRILHSKGTLVRLREMDMLSMKFLTRVWTTNSEYWDVYYDLMENIKRHLDNHQIKLPSTALNIQLNAEEGKPSGQLSGNNVPVMVAYPSAVSGAAHVDSPPVKNDTLSAA